MGFSRYPQGGMAKIKLPKVDLMRLSPTDRFNYIAKATLQYGDDGFLEATKSMTDRQILSFRDQLRAKMRGLGKPGFSPSPANLAHTLSGGQWKMADHLRYISDRLVELEQRKIKRLLISIGPRHGKSFLTDVWLCVWWLTRNPRARIILVGYGEQFAREWGARVRDLILEHAEKLNLVLNKEKMAADDWETSEGGGMICVGVGGALMGRGADLLILDDLVKTAEEANSETYRDKMWEWIQSTALTRLQPNAVVVGLMTRWHMDDVFGRLMEHQADKWTVINLPSLALDNDLLGRKPGEPLWPEFFTDDPTYEIRKSSMSEYYWNALHQGMPSPPGGDLIKEEWFQFYVQDPSWIASMQTEADQWIQSWDPALLDKTTSDFWVGQVWARKGAALYLVDGVRGHFTLAEAATHIRQFTLKYPKAVAKLMENTAMGPAIKQTLQHEIPGIVPLPAKGSKRSRVEAITPYLMGHNVYLPENTNGTKPKWVWEFVAECCAYPRGANDDQVDALSQAITFLVPGGWRDLRDSLNEDRRQRALQQTPAEIRKAEFERYSERVMAKATKRFGGKYNRSPPRW
jgi:predicted phage terminase large subunit-like protein